MMNAHHRLALWVVLFALLELQGQAHGVYYGQTDADVAAGELVG
jgi:hypothetical protein